MARLLSSIVVIGSALGFWGGAVAVPPTTSPTHTISIDGVRFEPAEIHVQAGERIVWVNKDPFAHTVTATTRRFDSKALAAGAHWSYVARHRGRYEYICTLHPTMKGTIVVE